MARADRTRALALVIAARAVRRESVGDVALPVAQALEAEARRVALALADVRAQGWKPSA